MAFLPTFLPTGNNSREVASPSFSVSDNSLSYETFNTKLLDRSIGTTEYALNGHMYEIQIFITNGEKIYGIAPTAIVALSIEDTIANWVSQGTLTIYNFNEIIEQNNYSFRNDGEDLLRIRILPRDLNIKGLPALNINSNRQLWEINQLFSIYNIEDIPMETQGGSDSKTYKKLKKLYFWDLRYQIMQTKNIEYSTALSPDAPINTATYRQDTTSLPPDEDRSIPTGIAIKEIIKTSLDNNPILSKTGLDTNEPEKYWDIGGRTIFYTSGAAENCFGDLEALKGYHISSTFLEPGVPDFSLLSTQRSSDGLSFFTLTPFSKIFSRAGAGTDQPGEDQIEHFYLHADAREESQQGITMYRAPKNSNFNSTRDITLRDFSFITSYELSDISPAVNASNFISYSVHSFDFKNKQFNIESGNHSYTLAQKLFQEKYISQLYKNGKSSGNNFLLDIQNNSKIKNYSVMPVFNKEGDPTKPEVRATSGMYRLLHTGLFQNTCINFTVPGLTLRQSGKFIGIDRPEGSLDNSFDDKLCGQWFVINVLHTITNGAYYNNITAIKIHRHKPTTLSERTREKFVNRFGGPDASLQDLLFSESNQLRQ
jgi:hypothetical protein